MLRVLRQPGRRAKPAARPTTKPDPVPVAPAPPAPRFAARPPASPAAAPAVAAATPPDPAPQDREVVCPRCGLHFEPRRRQASPQVAGRKTVLVVEDNPYFVEIVEEALKQRFEVRVVGGFVEALGALATGGIDLLVLDLVLGSGEDGRTLLGRLGAKPCPILVLTARDESEMYGEEWIQLQRLGADDMLLKGMNVGETLVRKACELLGVVADEDLD